MKKFGVTFAVAADTSDLLGQTFGLKAVPVTIALDERGIVRLRGHGPDAELLKKIEAFLTEPASDTEIKPFPAVGAKEDLERAVQTDPRDWKSRLALAQVYAEEKKWSEAIKQCEMAARVEPKESKVAFTWGWILLQMDRKEDALSRLRQARDLDPDNWRIRKQIWAIENPDKFYAGESPDYRWQKEQLKKEALNR